MLNLATAVFLFCTLVNTVTNPIPIQYCSIEAMSTASFNSSWPGNLWPANHPLDSKCLWRVLAKAVPKSMAVPSLSHEASFQSASIRGIWANLGKKDCFRNLQNISECCYDGYETLVPWINVHQPPVALQLRSCPSKAACWTSWPHIRKNDPQMEISME